MRCGVLKGGMRLAQLVCKKALLFEGCRKGNREKKKRPYRFFLHWRREGGRGEEGRGKKKTTPWAYSDGREVTLYPIFIMKHVGKEVTELLSLGWEGKKMKKKERKKGRELSRCVFLNGKGWPPIILAFKEKRKSGGGGPLTYFDRGGEREEEKGR